MTTPLLQAGLTGGVTLGLYAFYCYWEAGRADLAAGFRHQIPGLPGSSHSSSDGSGYRARARWAGTGALLLLLGTLALVG